MQKVLFRKTRVNAIVPRYDDKGDSGFLFYNPEKITLPANGEIVINTGICLLVPPNCELHIKTPVTKDYIAMPLSKNNFGVVDSQFREVVRIGVKNLTNKDINIPARYPVAYGCITPVIRCEFKEVTSFPDKWDGVCLHKVENLLVSSQATTS